MNRMGVHPFAWSLVLAAFSLPLFSQAKPQTTVNGTQYDYAIPDSPAAEVLNMSATAVSHPTTPRALSSALLNGFDKDGNFQSGIDIALSPYMLAYGSLVSLDQYQKSKVVRALARFQTSVATTKGTADDKSAKIGLGFRETVFDLGDPRMDKVFIKFLKNAITQATAEVQADRVKNGKSPGPDPTDEDDDLDYQKAIASHLSKLVDTRIANEKKASWNRSAWTIAAAPSWTSPDGSSSNMKWNGGAAWTSIGYGFDQVPGLRDTSEVIAGVQYHDREVVSSTSASGAASPTTYTRNSLSAGLRALIGTPMTNGSFEASYVENRPYGLAKEKYTRLDLEIEKRITKNLWLTVNAGGETNRPNGSNKMLILTAFKWGTSNGQ